LEVARLSTVPRYCSVRVGWVGGGFTQAAIHSLSHCASLHKQFLLREADMPVEGADYGDAERGELHGHLLQRQS